MNMVTAQRKSAQYRMDVLDGNTKSYAKWLNEPEQMEHFFRLQHTNFFYWCNKK